MRRKLAEYLIRLAVRLIATDYRKEITMGFQPPPNIPVPLVHIESIGLNMGIWAIFNGTANAHVVAAFVKEQGAGEFTMIGQGVIINRSEAELASYINIQHEGREELYLQREIFDVPGGINEDIDAYMRSAHRWEDYASSAISRPTEEEIAALRAVDQINWRLAIRGSIQIDATKKTVQAFA